MSAAVDLSGAVSQLHAIVMDPTTEHSDTIPLVRAARSGDRNAFGQLYQRYRRMVHGILLSRIPPCEVADLVHDVFLQALRQIHSLRNDAAFGGWLASIARNRATDHHRRRFVETARLPDGLESPREHESAGLAVLAEIRSLPQAYRETLVLRLVEGMSGNEIAARTGLTPASVRVNLHRGMAMRGLALIACALTILFAAAQRVPVERTNPATEPERSIEARTHMSPTVAEILSRSCYDCHSNETRWPWYSRVAPASWLLARDVNHGRRHLNFSTWGEFSGHGYPKSDDERLLDICREVSSGAMPLRSYTLVHRAARLTPEEVRIVCEWVKAESDRLRLVADKH